MSSEFMSTTGSTHGLATAGRPRLEPSDVEPVVRRLRNRHPERSAEVIASLAPPRVGSRVPAGVQRRQGRWPNRHAARVTSHARARSVSVSGRTSRTWPRSLVTVSRPGHSVTVRSPA